MFDITMYIYICIHIDIIYIIIAFIDIESDISHSWVSAVIAYHRFQDKFDINFMIIKITIDILYMTNDIIAIIMDIIDI